MLKKVYFKLWIKRFSGDNKYLDISVFDPYRYENLIVLGNNLYRNKTRDSGIISHEEIEDCMEFTL